MERETVWVDAARCTGCGECVRACPVGAIVLVDGKARVDEETCAACQACVDVCPEHAIQPIVHGELVQVADEAPPARYQPHPLARSVAAGVVLTGLGLLGKAAGALAGALGRWLAQVPSEAGSAASPTRTAGRPSSGVVGGGQGGGRRARRRHRGG